VAVPSAVNAGELGHNDSWKDVQVYNPSDGVGPDLALPAPERTIGDITGIHIGHNRYAVHVVVYFRALPHPEGTDQFQFRLRTPDLAAALRITAKPGDFHGTSTFTNAHGNQILCSRLRYVVDYSHKRVWINVPRGCIMRPTWVQVGMQTLVSTHPGDTATNRLYVDDALTSKDLDDYAPPALSGRIYR
jgi:hypothetical protein